MLSCCSKSQCLDNTFFRDFIHDNSFLSLIYWFLKGLLSTSICKALVAKKISLNLNHYISVLPFKTSVIGSFPNFSLDKFHNLDTKSCWGSILYFNF